jgi:hypothetical protein
MLAHLGNRPSRPQSFLVPGRDGEDIRVDEEDDRHCREPDKGREQKQGADPHCLQFFVEEIFVNMVPDRPEGRGQECDEEPAVGGVSCHITIIM